MNTTEAPTQATADLEAEYVSFYVGNILLGIEITQVDEINRHLEITAVPHAPEIVDGVLNLRGEVVTVVDLRMVLGLPPLEINRATRIVVVRSKGEQIGLRVDRVADVVQIPADMLDPVPPNLDSMDGRLFEGVYRLETELLIILNVDAALAVDANAR